jgi:hypothetical protein
MTVPARLALTGVPVETPMSTPVWMLPQRDPKPEVIGPRTGQR